MAGDFDRLKKALGELVKSLLRPLDYFALYPAAVISQNATSLALDVRPEDSRIPDLAGVPLHLGIPGCKVKVAAGARVLIGFENGEPLRPFACLWDTASVTELDLDATLIKLNGGSKGVARVDDAVNLGRVTATVSGATVLFTYTPPGGTPGAPNALLTLDQGKITSGAAGVKA